MGIAIGCLISLIMIAISGTVQKVSEINNVCLTVFFWFFIASLFYFMISAVLSSKPLKRDDSNPPAPRIIGRDNNGRLIFKDK